jgi:glycosyltransferase involved in cell wall biosynthesis
MTKEPKVSVLIPTYNAGAFLDESITSVLNQTYTNYELVIVDNCSTDNSEEIISKYLSDQRIRYYKNESNIGVVGNFNKCFSYAKGEYLKILCADDKFHPELLEKFVNVMEKFPNVSLVTSYSQEFGLSDKVLKAPFSYVVNGKQLICEILNNWNYLGHPSNVMIRKSGLAVGNFRNEYLWMADWEMWLRVLAIGDCYFIPEILSYTRFHETQVTNTMIKNFSHYFESYNLVKNIQQKNELKLDFSKLDINGLVKEKATNCALSIPWALFRGIHKNKNRQILSKALRIVNTEKVFIKSLKLLGSRLLNRANA